MRETSILILEQGVSYKCVSPQKIESSHTKLDSCLKFSEQELRHCIRYPVDSGMSSGASQSEGVNFW